MNAAELGTVLPAQIPSLRAFARTLTSGDAQADDLVQDTLVRALEKADSFRGDAALSTWLRRIMHNLAVDNARRRRETPVEDLGDAVEAAWREDRYTVDAETVVLRAESRRELEDALIHLPIIYRSMVLLHDAHAMTVQEIADIQSVGLPAAKQRLRRGRMMLVSQLANGHERRESLRGLPLRCWDARSHVSDYLDGDLGEPTVAAVERHLADCPTCPPLYASLVATRTALAGLGEGGALAAPVPPAVSGAGYPGYPGYPTPSSLGRDPDSVIPEPMVKKIDELRRG